MQHNEVTHKSWLPENQNAINQMIATYGNKNKDFNAKTPPVVTLDWDNTMIYNDIGEATFMLIADEMLFSYNDEFWKLIPDPFRNDLKSLYDDLNLISREERKLSPLYKKYRKILVQSYWHLCDTQGNQVCYAWAAQIMTGMSIPEVKNATNLALRQELDRPIGKESLKSDDNDQSPLQINTGIRYYPEMKKLVEQLKSNGFDVWVVSASTQWVVEVAAEKVGISGNKVIGMLPQLDQSLKLTSKMKRITYRQGKANAIKKIIKRLPIFAAGDSNTDLEMLLLGKGPRLVIDRGKKPLMEIAKKEKWLVQPKFYQK